MNRWPLTRPRTRPGAGPARAAAGFSLLELILVMGILATMSVVALGETRHAVRRYRIVGAARYLAGRLQQARAEAVARGANVAVRFGPAGSDIRFNAFVDGNHNGVLSADIADNVDVAIGPQAGLASFPGVTFGLNDGVVDVDGDAIGGTDPIRFGAARMASFTPRGTATPGSVYVRGPDGEQFVVRLYGDTGRTSILRFDARGRQWLAL